MPFGQQSTDCLNCVPQNVIDSVLKLILAAVGKFPSTFCLCKISFEYSWQLLFRAEWKLPGDQKTRSHIEQKVSFHSHLLHSSWNICDFLLSPRNEAIEWTSTRAITLPNVKADCLLLSSPLHALHFDYSLENPRLHNPSRFTFSILLSLFQLDALMSRTGRLTSTPSQQFYSVLHFSK